MRNLKCKTYKLKGGAGEIAVRADWILISYPLYDSNELQYYFGRLDQITMQQSLTDVLSAFFLFRDIFTDEKGKEYFLEDVARDILSLKA